MRYVEYRLVAIGQQNQAFQPKRLHKFDVQFGLSEADNHYSNS